MSRILVTEDEIRDRHMKHGKSAGEVDTLIGKHLDASNSPPIDVDALSSILRNVQHDSTLRVRGFKLTKEQYDSLLSYFEDASAAQAGYEHDANYLVVCKTYFDG